MSSDHPPPPWAPDRSPSADPTGPANVFALNDDGALYLTLASEIRGAAIGLSPAARQLLRSGLVERFGPLFAHHGDKAVDELLRLATEPRAA